MVRLRLGGHPLHPVLAHFPIALWTLAIGADLAGWQSGQQFWWPLGFGCQALGVVIAAIAMAAGLLDYAALARQHPAQDTAVRHFMAMSMAWVLFVFSLALRGGIYNPPSVWAVLAALLGWLTMAYGGWMGGQLVYRFGVGVDSGAAQNKR